MEISICTISYNQRDFIGSCLKSVATSRALSDGDMVEHIVFDAQSNNGTLEVLRSSDAIDRLIIENDKGPVEGLNKAFSCASGEFGFFTNADDCVPPASIPEVVGDAGLLFNPNNIDEIADKIECLLYDTSVREVLIKKGLKRAMEFTWSGCGLNTLNLYKRSI